MRRVLFALAGAYLAVSLCFPAHARAEIVVTIHKPNQRMSVAVDGRERHYWPVSTGLGGGPPSGSYRPQRLERKWFSRKYGWSPMPHSIFFHEGYAIHGTIYVSRLGRRASHGCVRLHPTHAAMLFDLVRTHGMQHTTIVVSAAPRLVSRD
jgi:lipoprotein-anchoring transpeptidase ErfK/SrfK